MLLLQEKQCFPSGTLWVVVIFISSVLSINLFSSETGLFVVGCRRDHQTVNLMLPTYLRLLALLGHRPSTRGLGLFSPAGCRSSSWSWCCLQVFTPGVSWTTSFLLALWIGLVRWCCFTSLRAFAEWVISSPINIYFLLMHAAVLSSVRVHCRWWCLAIGCKGSCTGSCWWRPSLSWWWQL